MSNELPHARTDSKTRPYELTLEEREDYLYAHVRANFVDLEMVFQYTNDLMSHVRETKHSKVLFIKEVPHSVREITHSLAASVLVTLLPEDTKLAVVDASPSHALVKKVINERQHPRHPFIDVFDSFDEAETWLLAVH